VSDQTPFRRLGDDEVQTMRKHGCTAQDWSQIEVSDGFVAERVRNTHFQGTIRIGRLSGDLDGGSGVRKPCGIDRAYVVDCAIGDGSRIANVGVHLANYDIGPGALIENVGTIETRAGATFGNGVEIEPLNEGGGREVVLFNRLDSQFAHLMCLHRYRTEVMEKLRSFAETEADRVTSDRGTIGRDARIQNVKQITDVNIGECARVEGAASLENGTVLSSEAAPALVGCDVQAEDFIIAEGSQVTGGAVVSSSFVGQGCKVGRQFSSEGSLFFANCEGFHGEACSVFAGPYTVTHHKSTLLIAGLFSFYNAGSGTNQSNHLYKLGPVHEGRLERGCKTGSFSYLMWPCRVGPFSVVLGKHTRTFDTGDFPFSYLEALPDGRCLMTAGFNLTTVGTVRDGAKWPARDRRQGSCKRDRLSFDVLSPLTVGRMMTGMARMKEIQETTDRAVDLVNISGTLVKRVLLRTSQKFYRSAIQMYLLSKVVARVEAGIRDGKTSSADILAASDESVFSEQWVDIGGQMMPRGRLEDICQTVESGGISDLDGLNQALDQAQTAYADDEWAWVRWAFCEVFDKSLDTADLVAVADDLAQARGRFLKLVLNDAAKEFDAAVATGFGQDGKAEDASADFAAVRGEFDTNKFVVQMQEDVDALAERVARFKDAVAGIR